MVTSPPRPNNLPLHPARPPRATRSAQLKGRPVKGKKFSWELQPSYCMQTRIGG